MSVNDSVSNISQISPKLAKSLSSMGIHTIADLLNYFPSRYLDFSKFTLIENLHVGEVVTVRGTIKSIASRFSFATKKNLSEAIVSDETGSIKVTWFNQGYIAETLKKGDQVLLSGKVDNYKGLQLTNPIYEKVTTENIHTGRLVPVYKLPSTIFPKTFRKLIHELLPLSQGLIDIIPAPIKSKYHILDIAEATQELHFPTSIDKITQARERLAFEESFVQQLATELHRLELQALSAPSIATNISYIKSLIEKLPFTLTVGQKKALWQILQDLEYKHPMNRLLQGDVGSGKTIVALLAGLQTMQKGYQVALLVPTEVLAKQHFESICKQISNFPPKADQPRADKFQISKVGLLTSNFRQFGDGQNLKKKEILEHIANGKIHLLIGTHAILQESIKFKNLAFVIVDEQHRFGVGQRKTLLNLGLNSHGREKGAHNKPTLPSPHESAFVPHLLSMTATPIPRTAALALYGNLEISTIEELPKNRLPIKTWVVPEDKRRGAYEFIKKEIASGRQAFIITPLVEESEKLQAKSAKAEFERLQKEVFPHLKLGLVYGSMKGIEKDKVMLAFKNAEVDILVATSVIEIGIDIPNASVIVIEDADRFGLAQLHQLRGRVGRGAYQSYCLLFSNVTTSSERLDFFTHTNNGFRLAEYDMRTRGFGSLFGNAQTGFNFKYGQYLSLKVLEHAKSAAKEIIATSHNLDKYPLLNKLATPLSEELHME